MTYRPNGREALVRIWRGPVTHIWRAVCQAEGCGYAPALAVVAADTRPESRIAVAIDVARDHLRAHHPDLFEKCPECGGYGEVGHYPAGPAFGPELIGCPDCQGHGWTYTKEGP